MKVLNLENKHNREIIFHKKDKKILSLLCKNVRIPISKIAKMVGISRQSAEYRINVMHENHLIPGALSVINIKKLGYHSYHFFVNFLSGKEEKEFIERCLKNENVNTLVSYSGKLNFEVSIMAKTPEEAKEIFGVLTKNLNLSNCFLAILLDNIKASILPGIVEENIPLIKNIKNDMSFSKQFNLNKINYEPDLKDKKILFFLSQDAKIPVTSIAGKVKLTKDAVSYRIRNLIRGNYLIQFRPIIDYSVLDLSIQTVLIRTKNQGNKKEFIENLKKNNSVLWASECLGDWDYILYIINKKPEDIHSFVKNMKDSFEDFILNYEILFAYQEHKYSFMTESMMK